MARPIIKVITPIIIVIVGLIIAAVLFSSATPPEQAPMQRPPLTVDVIEVEKQKVGFVVESQGTMQPRHITTMVSQVSGLIVDVDPVFTEGGFFKKGQILVRIEQSDYLTALKSAQADLARAKAALEEEKARAKVAEDEWSSISSANKAAPELYLRKPQLAREVANVSSAEAEVERAKRELERTEIRAPYDGLIREKHVDLGQFVSKGGQLAKIYGTALGEVRLPLTDADLAFLNLPGFDPEQLYSPSVELASTVGGKEYHWRANIVRSEGVIDSNRRVVFAVAQVEQPYDIKVHEGRPPLSFGRFVRAKITGTDVDNIVVLPRNALHAGHQLLIVDEDRKLRVRDVVVERLDPANVYISGGVEQGEMVSMTPISNPIEGMLVRLPDDEVETESTVVEVSETETAQ